MGVSYSRYRADGTFNSTMKEGVLMSLGLLPGSLTATFGFSCVYTLHAAAPLALMSFPGNAIFRREPENIVLKFIVGTSVNRCCMYVRPPWRAIRHSEWGMFGAVLAARFADRKICH